MKLKNRKRIAQQDEEIDRLTRALASTTYRANEAHRRISVARALLTEAEHVRERMHSYGPAMVQTQTVRLALQVEQAF